MSHWKDNCASLDKLLEDDLYGLGEWSVLMLGLIIGTRRSTLDGDIVARSGLIARLSIELIIGGGGFGGEGHSMNTFSIGDPIIDKNLIFGPILGLVIIRGRNLITFFIWFQCSFL